MIEFLTADTQHRQPACHFPADGSDPCVHVHHPAFTPEKAMDKKDAAMRASTK